MFIDSASRLKRPYGAGDKSAAAIFSGVKRVVADMGVPRAFRTHSGTEYSNSMLVGFSMVSELVANLRHRIRHSRMDPPRARYHELLRLDTRRDFKFRNCTRNSAWKRSGVAPTLQEQAFGWSRYSGYRSALAGRQHQRTTSGFAPVIFPTGATRACHTVSRMS